MTNYLEAEINWILQKILRSPDCSLGKLRREGAAITLLSTAKEFFDEKKRMVDSLGKEDEYILIVGRPFLHLLPEERDELTSQLSPSAKAYLDALNAHLETGTGYFIYFVDPFATVEQMLSKLHYSFKDVRAANDLLLQEIKRYGKRLTMYAAPPSMFGLDCILVNNANIQYQVVLGHRPLGRNHLRLEFESSQSSYMSG